jgi:co-chaperonin GroES (HSP10)
MQLLNKTVLVKGITNKKTESGIILASENQVDKEVYIYYVVEDFAKDCTTPMKKGDKLLMFTPHHSQTWSEKLCPNKDLFIIYERDILAIV